MASPVQQQIEGVAAAAGQRQDLIPFVDLQNLHGDHCNKSVVGLQGWLPTDCDTAVVCRERHWPRNVKHKGVLLQSFQLPKHQAQHRHVSHMHVNMAMLHAASRCSNHGPISVEYATG